MNTIDKAILIDIVIRPSKIQQRTHDTGEKGENRVNYYV